MCVWRVAGGGCVRCRVGCVGVYLHCTCNVGCTGAHLHCVCNVGACNAQRDTTPAGAMRDWCDALLCRCVSPALQLLCEADFH